MEQPIHVWNGAEGNITLHNERKAAATHRGWIFGPFLTLPDGQSISQSLEIKRTTLASGESREEWSSGSAGQSVEILLSGKLRKFFKLDNKEIAIDTSPGDIISWSNTTPHRWLVLEKAELIFIRTLH